jgi:hypothetical protein
MSEYTRKERSIYLRRLCVATYPYHSCDLEGILHRQEVSYLARWAKRGWAFCNWYSYRFAYTVSSYRITHPLTTTKQQKHLNGTWRMVGAVVPLVV